MPQPNKIPLAFASSGDKNVIPENTETTGLASWREGFPAITSAPFSEGGIAPKRADFNGIFNALSQAVMWMQQGGVYVYDSNTDYEAGNIVLDAGGLYVANAANGPSSSVVQPSTDTTGATWKPVRLDLATQTAAGYMSAEDKTKLDSVILTNATQSAAGYMSAADKTALDGVPTTYYPLAGGALSGQSISRDVTTSVLRLLGGTNNENGSYLNLWGKDSGSAAGTFNLIARKTTAETAMLTGSTDGTLTWNAKDISPVETITLENQLAIAEYVNKLQLNARLIGVSNGDTVIFNRPFAEKPCVVLCQSNNINGVFAPYDISTTGFKVFSTFGTPAYGYYFAIGKGV